LIAAYQSTFLRPTDLAVQTDFGRVAFRYAGLGVTYDTVRKDGLKAIYGPIGDRPPRTLNIQVTEPVDYRTNDLTISGEHSGARYLAQFEYLFSDFANSVDTLLWQNVFTTAQPGATYDVWDRSVSTYGRRPLRLTTVSQHLRRYLRRSAEGKPPVGPRGLWPHDAERDVAALQLQRRRARQFGAAA
jgi:hypothetical protein